MIDFNNKLSLVDAMDIMVLFGYLILVPGIFLIMAKRDVYNSRRQLRRFLANPLMVKKIWREKPDNDEYENLWLKTTDNRVFLVAYHYDVAKAEKRLRGAIHEARQIKLLKVGVTLRRVKLHASLSH